MNNGAPQSGQKLYTLTFLIANVMNFLLLTASGLYVLFPLRLEDLHFNQTHVGIIMGSYYVAGMLCRLIVGPLIDRLGRKFFIRFGIIVNVICALLFLAPYHSEPYLIAVRVLHGIGAASYFTAVFTWAADYAPPGRMAESIGMFGISGLLTIASAPFLGEYVLAATKYNYNSLFLSHMILCFFGMALSFGVPEVHREDKSADRNGFFRLMLRPDVASIVIISLFFGFGNGTVFTFTAPFIRRMQVDGVSAFFAFYTIAAVSIRLFSGKIADKVADRRLVLFPGFVITVLGLSYLFTINVQQDLFVLGFILGCAHGIIFPALSAFMMDRVGANRRGVGTSIFNASSDMGNLLGAYLAGVLSDAWGHGPMFAFMGIIISAGFLTFMFMEMKLAQKGGQMAESHV